MTIPTFLSNSVFLIVLMEDSLSEVVAELRISSSPKRKETEEPVTTKDGSTATLLMRELVAGEGGYVII